MKKNLPISVIMPVYNANQAELRIAIESILNQTFADFEFIIINDGSTNDSEEVILSYRDDRIRYYKNDENIKLIRTLNWGLELSDGEFIARLDADDYSEKTRFEKQIAVLRENPSVGIVSSYIIRIPNSTHVKLPTESKDIKMFLRYCSNCVAHSAVMLRKSVLECNNLKYNENCLHAEDYKLWSDMSKYCEISTVPEYLLYYRESPQGLSALNSLYQQKMASIIKLDNIISDFECDKIYMYSILVKYVKNEPLTGTEYDALINLLSSVVSFVTANITDTYKIFVEGAVFSVLKFVNRVKE